MNTPIELSHPAFHDEDAARQYLEELRWADGVVCPHCGGMEKIAKLRGGSMGPGWWHCGDCRRKFTVRVGSIFERSHIPLHKWLLAFRLMASSKKGISAHQLHRTLGITYKSAWFLAHRVREALKDTDNSPLGGSGKIVEADETFLGTQPYEYNNEKGWRRKTGVSHMKRSLRSSNAAAELVQSRSTTFTPARSAASSSPMPTARACL